MVVNLLSEKINGVLAAMVILIGIIITITPPGA